VASHAARHDVLILRGFDLYNLLARSLAGDPAGEKFVETLRAGGGWLEVTDSTLKLYIDGESDI
jgi:hypothetical protein